MIGTRLAHYQITNHLGTGRMGEVYQATDSKLGRRVAIKVLPDALASTLNVCPVSGARLRYWHR